MGPRGVGPISGGGRGMCVVKLPDEASDPITGVAGQVGWSFSQPLETGAELERLHRQARHIETLLWAIQARIERMIHPTQFSSTRRPRR